MKSVNLFLFKIFIILLASYSAKAQQTFTTAKGFVFTRVQDARFGSTWKDPQGLVWSPFQGEFSNLGTLGNETVNEHGDHEVIDSAAVEACKTIQGKLPSLEDYKTFLDYFESAAEFQSLFPRPPSASHMLWTSTALLPQFVRFVKVAPLDPFGDVVNSSRRLSVYCVRR